MTKNLLDDIDDSLSAYDRAEKLQKKVADKYGYELVDHKLELYGVKKKS